MKISEMIEVLQAYEMGEKIEYRNDDRNWEIATHPSWSFKDFDYRIAQKKKELSLVDELREVAKEAGTLNLPVEQVVLRAADRIEELESCEPAVWLKDITTDELLSEIKRRTT